MLAQQHTCLRAQLWDQIVCRCEVANRLQFGWRESLQSRYPRCPGALRGEMLVDGVTINDADMIEDGRRLRGVTEA